jgi:hypothetical protein
MCYPCEDGLSRKGTICMTQRLTTEILNAALESLTAKRHQVDEQIAEVRRMLGSHRSEGSTASDSPAPKHRISAAGRRAIAAAQRRRWAAQRSANTGGAAEKKAPRRKLSPAGRAAIVAALKKRWAAKRAEPARAGKEPARHARAA